MAILPFVVGYLTAGVIVLPVVEYLKRRAFPLDANFQKTAQFGRDKAQFPDGKPLVYKVADNLAELIAHLSALLVWPVLAVMFIFRLYRGEN